MDWIDLVQNKWRAVVNVVVNFGATQKAVNFLSGSF